MDIYNHYRDDRGVHLNLICNFGVDRPGTRHSFTNYDDDGWSLGKRGMGMYPDTSRIVFALEYVVLFISVHGWSWQSASTPSSARRNS